MCKSHSAQAAQKTAIFILAAVSDPSSGTSDPLGLSLLSSKRYKAKVKLPLCTERPWWGLYWSSDLFSLADGPRELTPDEEAVCAIKGRKGAKLAGSETPQ